MKRFVRATRGWLMPGRKKEWAILNVGASRLGSRALYAVRCFAANAMRMTRMGSRMAKMLMDFSPSAALVALALTPEPTPPANSSR